MCGIVGVVAKRNVSPILIEGLKRLEYRGYDSAGLAIIDDANSLQCLKKAGKVSALADALKYHPIEGKIGVAHTRWATHGEPSENNAHPHHSHDEFAVVHNGIIENYQVLKSLLQEKGYRFLSETDSEVVVHLLHYYFTQDDDVNSAFKKLQKELKGAFALAIIHSQSPDKILLARSGSPLVIGVGLEENFVASDQLALLSVTDRFIFLEEGDSAEISTENISIWNNAGQLVERPVVQFDYGIEVAERGQYRHFMQKEIFEQSTVIQQLLKKNIITNAISPDFFSSDVAQKISKTQAVQIVACGTSFHAGLVAKYWIEDIAKLPCQVEVASEFRYRQPVVQPNTLLITISQSGETADTLAALRSATGENYLASLAVCNVASSSLVRESSSALLTEAGVEIGVASTKAFTSQLLILLFLTLKLAELQQTQSVDDTAQIIQSLLQLPIHIDEVLQLDQTIKLLAEQFVDKHHALFLGRGTHYPIAMEGALKLKEISYIHAEAYPAGELKHGPLALVDHDMPVIVMAPSNQLLAKLKSNLHEVQARGGKLIVFADQQANVSSQNDCQVIELPHVHPLITPIVYTIPLQLFAYHVAVLKGTDVDQPRNLAKSVTVE